MLKEKDKILLIGKNIAKRRKALNYTQDKLAEIADTSRDYLAKLETGKKRMSLNMLFKIADALKVPESVLMEFNTAEN